MSVERCEYCGAPYQEGAAYCINCGKARPELATASPGETGAGPEEPAAVPETGEPPGESGAEDPSSEPEAEAPSSEPDEGAETPPADESVAAGSAEPLSEPEKPDETAERLEREANPEDRVEFEPSKKGRGCCLALALAGVLGFVVVVIIVAALSLGLFGGGRPGTADVYDFSSMDESDFEVWSKGKDAVVANEKGMLKVRNALVGLEKDYGRDYGVEVTVFFPSADGPGAWAGPVLRVNPGGGDRYAFMLVPAADKVVVKRTDGKVLGEKGVKIEKGVAYKAYAEAAGNDLGFAVNDRPLVKVSDIGLIAGGIGLEARGCTAYFDDLKITVLE